MKIKMLRNLDEFLRQMLLLLLDDGHHLAFAGDLREGGTIMLIVACYQVDLQASTSLGLSMVPERSISVNPFVFIF